MTKRKSRKPKREGISLLELMERFPDEQTAHDWFAERRWGVDGRHCPRCGSDSTRDSKRLRYYWCLGCRQRFTVRTDTVMESSKIPLRKWAIAVYLCSTSLKGVASTRLARDLDITQKSAWFLGHRIREAMTFDPFSPFTGPVEVDETYFGGRRKNMSNKKRKALKDAGRGPSGKVAVVGVKDRNTGRVSAKVVKRTDADTLQLFVRERVALGATVYTDDAKAYRGLAYLHRTVRHSVGEYVNGMAHTNGIESFWSLLKRGYVGTYHYMSAKHLHRYVNEFSARKAVREWDTMRQMGDVVTGMVGGRLTYSALVERV